MIAARLLSTTVLSTWAAMAALPGLPQACVVWCEEADAPYLFVPNDVSPVDGVTSIAPAGGTPGRFLIGSDRVSVAPLGSNADDWPRFVVTICGACSPKGVRVEMRAGTWLCKSVQALPNAGIDIVANDAVIVVSSLVPNADPQNAPISALAGATIGNTTIDQVNVIGSDKIHVVANVPVGTIVTVNDAVSGSGFRGNTYTVRAIVADAGTFKATVDRPVLYQFGIGDPVVKLPAIPTRIRIFGNGMRITGTGTRLLEITGSRHCSVSDVRFVPDSGMTADLVASYDSFGYDNEYCHVEVDGGGIGHVGLGLETQERSRIRDGSQTHHLTQTGINFYDCVLCWSEDSESWGNDVGLGITADGNTIGCVDCEIRGGNYNSNTSFGIAVLNGSTNTRIGCNARFNGTNLAIGGGGTVSGTVASGRFSGATTIGISVASATSFTKLRAIDVSDSPTGLNFAGGDVDTDGCLIGGTITTAAVVLQTGTFNFRGLDIKRTSGGAINVFQHLDGRVNIVESHLNLNASCNGINTAGGVLSIATTVIEQNGNGVIAIYGSNVGTIRLGTGINTNGCTTPIRIDSGYCSIGIVLANGSGNPQAVAWPDLKAKAGTGGGAFVPTQGEDHIDLSRVVTGAVPTAMLPLITKTDGVGFSVTFGIGDTNTYEFNIR